MSDHPDPVGEQSSEHVIEPDINRNEAPISRGGSDTAPNRSSTRRRSYVDLTQSDAPRLSESFKRRSLGFESATSSDQGIGSSSLVYDTETGNSQTSSTLGPGEDYDPKEAPISREASDWRASSMTSEGSSFVAQTSPTEEQESNQTGATHVRPLSELSSSRDPLGGGTDRRRSCTDMEAGYDVSEVDNM